MLGGTSSMNAMVYIRGNRADYDGWAADGARGWSYNEVLPYFIKTEANERGEDQFHGKLGPLSVCEGRSRNPLMDAFVEAAVEAGYPKNPDFNGATQDGVGLFQSTQRNGMRCSAAAAYLHPAMAGPISRSSRTRMRRGSCSTASGRAASKSPSTAPRRDPCRQGSDPLRRRVQFPAIAALSGIGPAADLAMLQIPVRRTCPSGRDAGPPDDNDDLVTDTETLMTALSAENVGLLQSEGRGPLTSNIGEAGGFSAPATGSRRPTCSSTPAPVNVL